VRQCEAAGVSAFVKQIGSAPLEPPKPYFTKAGRWREIPLTDGAEQALEEIRGEDGYVLPRMRLESLSRACIRESKRAGLSGSIHTLRHTYISHLVMGGTPLRTVKELAGHSSITVTEGYAHLAPDHLAKAGRSITF